MTPGCFGSNIQLGCLAHHSVQRVRPASSSSLLRWRVCQPPDQSCPVASRDNYDLDVTQHQAMQHQSLAHLSLAIIMEPSSTSCFRIIPMKLSHMSGKACKRPLRSRKMGKTGQRQSAVRAAVQVMSSRAHQDPLSHRLPISSFLIGGASLR